MKGNLVYNSETINYRYRRTCKTRKRAREKVGIVTEGKTYAEREKNVKEQKAMQRG